MAQKETKEEVRKPEPDGDYFAERAKRAEARKEARKTAEKQ